ncbi:MAG: dicarboxylate/amino acid:cation symporter [Isosphaeraceae bacterium]|nr:dicarboxylate/amino acid:cation symporter [Isosphaeraceae bacterium]
MTDTPSEVLAAASTPAPEEPESRFAGVPLYVWVVLAAIIAVPVGYYWGPGAASLEILPRLIIKLLKAFATPLIVLAILSALVGNEIKGRQGARMMFYYLINTLVAITLGLVFSNLIRPGIGADLPKAADLAQLSEASKTVDASKSVGGLEAVLSLVEQMIPVSVGDALAKNNLAQLVVVALVVGIALVRIRDERRRVGDASVEHFVEFLNVAFEAMMRVLLWIVALVPFAVFGVVASNIGQYGFAFFQSLLWFIVVVLLGLACQIAWYLIQLGVFAKMSPLRFLSGARNVMATTFSTASTGATMPVTLRALTDDLGVSRPSAQLAACVGTNFNNDGTALYQASVVLFLSQAMGGSLSIADQLLIVVTTVIASIGAGNIPSGSFVTLPLIFAAVGLPADQLPLILTIDWFLDRCRTTSNVLGDMTVAILLDKTAETQPEAPPAVE